MTRANETRHIEWHKTCKSKCRSDASVCIENIYGNKMLHNDTLDVISLNDYKNVRNCIKV